MIKLGTENDIFKKWNKDEVKLISPLKLAYIGDAVYEILVRRYLIDNFEGAMNKVHRESTKYVKAEGQANIVHSIEDIFSDEEKDIVRRGRNAKSGTIPKNAKIQNYKYATGYEALIGYLFLLNREERITELFKYIIENEVINR